MSLLFGKTSSSGLEADVPADVLGLYHCWKRAAHVNSRTVKVGIQLAGGIANYARRRLAGGVRGAKLAAGLFPDKR